MEEDDNDIEIIHESKIVICKTFKNYAVCCYIILETQFIL